MKIATLVVTGLLIAFGSGVSHAQVPAVLGTWKLDVEAPKRPYAESPRPGGECR